MKNLKFSLIDNDFVLNAKTNLNIHDDADFAFAKFLRKIEEELVTGESASLEIEGLHDNPVTFAISHFE